MFKAQKGSKYIIKIVHVHQWFNLNFMKLQEYFLCNFTQQFLGTHMHGTLVNVRQRLNHWCTWIILMMYLPPFWALNKSVALLSMEFSDFITNLLIYVLKMNEVLTGSERNKGE